MFKNLKYDKEDDDLGTYIALQGNFFLKIYYYFLDNESILGEYSFFTAAPREFTI